METQADQLCVAFAGVQRIATGPLEDAVLQVKAIFDQGETRPIFIFDAFTSKRIEVDLSCSVDEVARRVKALYPLQIEGPSSEHAERRGQGRPKLGVVGREVTLLPRHWEWLNAQPGGASVALRKLVEQARRDNEPLDRLRRAQEAAYAFMSAMAGDEIGFEEASRALFAWDAERFEHYIQSWPADVREHARTLFYSGAAK